MGSERDTDPIEGAARTPREPGPEDAPEGDEAYQDEAPATPFDHPFFLPAILAALALWFFYDGFINQDPEMLTHLYFNRGGFTALGLAALWFGYKGFREMRAISEEEQRRRQLSDQS